VRGYELRGRSLALFVLAKRFFDIPEARLNFHVLPFGHLRPRHIDLLVPADSTWWRQSRQFRVINSSRGDRGDVWIDDC
jgi:hypothetical protein